MLGFLIWPFVVIWGAMTERLWPDAVRRIAIVTVALFGLSVANLYLGNNPLIDDREMALRTSPVALTVNFLIKLASASAVFMIGYGFGKWKRRAK